MTDKEQDQNSEQIFKDTFDLKELPSIMLY